MSTVHAPVASDRDARPAGRHGTGARARVMALSADHVAVLALATVAVLLAAITWNRWGDPSYDTGLDLVAGAKVSHAHLPYLDFDYWYGPLAPMLLGVVFEVAGIAMGPAVGLGLLLAAACIGLTYAVGRLLLAPLPAALAAALAAVPALSSTNISYVQPHALDAPLGVLLALVAVLAAARYATTGARRWVAATGACLGLCLLTKPESAIALGLALGGWLAVRAVVAGADGRRRALGDIALALGPALLVGLGGYAAFFVTGAVVDHPLTLGALIHRDLFPTGLLRESVSVIYDVLAPRTPASFLGLAADLALYLTGTAGLIAIGLTLAGRAPWRRTVLAVAGLAVVGVLVVLVARPDTVRFYLKWAFAWMPAGALLAAVLLAWLPIRLRARSWSRAGQVQLLLALLAVGFSYSAYARFAPYPNPGFQQATAYAMPVLAILLCWLHVRVAPRLLPLGASSVRLAGTVWVALLVVCCLGLLVHDARQETGIVRGPHGTIRATPADASAYQQAIDVVLRRTRRSEPILLAPQMTSLYVLSGRQDVLDQLSLLPGALATPADERAAIRTLDERRVRLAITDRTPLSRYRRGAFGVGYDRLLGAWLRRDFTRLTTLRGTDAAGHERSLDVWLRRTQ